MPYLAVAFLTLLLLVPAPSALAQAGVSYRVPAGQPVRRPGRGGAGGVRIRPAESLPLLVRPRTGDLLIGDVGGAQREEIDWIGAAAARGRELRLGLPRGDRRGPAARQLPGAWRDRAAVRLPHQRSRRRDRRVRGARRLAHRPRRALPLCRLLHRPDPLARAQLREPRRPEHGRHGRHAVVIRRGRGRPPLRREQRRRPGGAPDRGQRPRRARYRGAHRLVQPAGRDRHLPRRCRSAVRGRAGGQGQARGERRRAPHAVPGRGAFGLTGGGERGLLSVVAAPDYASSGKVYVYYTDGGGDIRMEEFTRSPLAPEVADPATRRTVLTIEHSQADESQRRPAPLRRRRLPVDHARATAAARTTSSTTRRTSAPCSGSCCDWIPTPRGRPSRRAATRARQAPSADTTAPVLRARVPRRQRVLRRRGAVAYVRCSEACTLSVGGTLRIGRRKLLLRRASGAAHPSPRKRFKVRLRKRSARVLRRALANGRRPRVHIRMRARDAAGNRSALVRRSLRVRR